MRRRVKIYQNSSAFNFEDSEVLNPSKKEKKEKSVYEKCLYRINYTESDLNLVKMLSNRFKLT